MKILFVYYTGTYNTRFLTDLLILRLEEHGHICSRVEIERGVPPADTEGYDLIGFGYPIYGFNSPLPFNRYVNTLEIERGQKFFIYKNSGETFAMNNASSRILLRRMKRRGAAFAGEYHFVMPYNIHFAFDREFVREILDKDEKLARIMIDNLERGEISEIGSNFIYNVASAAVSVQKIASIRFFTKSTKKNASAAGCAFGTVPKRISVWIGERSNSGTAAICACAVRSFVRRTPSASAF